MEEDMLDDREDDGWVVSETLRQVDGDDDLVYKVQSTSAKWIVPDLEISSVAMNNTELPQKRL
jgi:hypothetical protein